MSRLLYAVPNARRGFTLVELMVVIIIIGILSSLTLAGLANARSRSKADASRFIIRKLSDAIMEQYESYEDLALTISTPTAPYTTALATLRARMREELPDSWADVAPSTNVPTATTALGRSFQSYKARFPNSASNKSFQGAECLYMIVTESGLFPDFIGSLRQERVGDIDADGAREFLDGWGRPIEFMRWAPGLPSLLTAIQIPKTAAGNPQPDPFDVFGIDSNAFALFPLVYSSGPDGATGEAGAYGLVVAEDGWPNAALSDICNFKPKNSGIVGEASTDSTAYRDNITNHQLIVE